ncbi:MAG TPA: hypothetical protein DEF34_10955 [Desulfotomaculum sp.]|nr:MAG: hypothetical protein VR67_00510 [Peptococcaceae bacterium BRH_c8a]KJS70716.1 MAG: hypothetical protein JL56_16385 [Desulfotomaculum sp. BICA1-6]HBX24131.1 hypothetical protein [Desulfotomaculum sp.]
MRDKTFFIRVKRNRITTNLMLNSVYSKRRLISELENIIDALEKLPDEQFLIDFKTSPAIGIEITSYEEISGDN